MLKDKKRLRLLLLVPNWEHIAKTQFVFFKRLEEYFEVIRYGPGFVPLNRLETDAEKIINKIDPDLVIIDEILFFNNLRPERYNINKKLYKFNFNLKNYCRNKSSFPENLDKVKCPVFVSLLCSDYYNFKKIQIERLRRLVNSGKNRYVIGYDRYMLKYSDELVDIEKEWFGSNVNDRMADFVRKYEPQVIPLLHMIDRTEFVFRKKKRTLCVPGAQYYFRKLVKRYLKKAGIKYRSYSLINMMLIFLDIKKLLPISKSGFLMDIYYRSFRNLIAHSVISFTEGSRLRWPIRKYFEVPAFGSLLLCEPCSGFERLGFLDNVNCVTVTEPSQVPEKIRYIDRNNAVAEKITIAGQKFVSEKHSGRVRARQFRNIFDLIRKNMFKKAYWENGDIYCDDMSGNKVKV